MGLESAFAANSGALTAQDCFTDRVDERVAVAGAAARVRQRLGDDDLVVDVQSPRVNVLVFYGSGGIGKTSLSMEIERELASLAGSSTSARLDFNNGSMRDPEEIVLRMRASLTSHVNKPRAFDSLFALYWRSVHPDVSLKSYLEKRRWASGLGIADAVDAGIVDVITEAFDASTFGLAGLGRRVATAGVSALIEQARQSRLSRDCPRYADALDASAEELLPFLTYFLAWDVAAVQREQVARGEEPLVPVFFYDTWEEVQAESKSRGSLEDFCSTAAWNMPNALHVFTGRDRLAWTDADAGARLRRGGASSWPNLEPGAVGEPRQHLLGALSVSDCDHYLRHALVRNGNPAISREAREWITAASHGHPYHLDLAVDVCADLLSRDMPLSVELLSQPFPELVSRIIRHLDPGERDLLFAASIMGSFSVASLMRTVPTASPSGISRFVQRHLVRHTGDDWLPYALHDNVRDAVFRATRVAGGAWPESEWDDCTSRALDWISESVFSEVEPNLERLCQATILYARLMGPRDPSTPFVERVEQLRLLGAVNAIDAVLQALTTATDGTSQDLSRCLRLARAVELPRGRVATEALRLLESTEDARVRSMLTEVGILAALTAGDLETGRVLLGHKSPSVGDEFDVALREGDFVTARVALEVAADVDSPAERAAWADRRGHVELAEGDLRRARDAFGTAMVEAGLIESPLWMGRACRHAALAATLMGGDEAPELVALARESNPLELEYIGWLQCEALEGALQVRAGDLHSLSAVSSVRQRLMENEAWVDVGLVVQLEVFACLRAGIPVDSEIRTLVVRPEVWAAMRWRQAVVADWLGLPTAGAPARWSRPVTEVLAAWRSVLR